MKNIYSLNYNGTYKGFFILLFLLSFITSGLYGQENLFVSRDSCVNGYSATLVDSSSSGSCLTFSLMVHADGTQTFGLSHMNIGIPCGSVTGVYNSRGWSVEKNILDPTTGIKGIKIDNIRNFGESAVKDSFLIRYTVCSAGKECMDELLSSINLAFKAGGCIFPDSIIADREEEEEKPLAMLRVENPKCFNSHDGSVYAEVKGGTEPYSYLWSTGSTSSVIYGLTAGIYSLKVTDANGNMVEQTAELKQPESAVGISAEIVDASCASADGSISLSVSGGTAPYSYMWGNGSVSPVLSNIAAGSYVVIVTDSLGCTASRKNEVGTNTDLSLELTANYLECYQEGEGEITSNVSGGTEPYEYVWSNGATGADASGLNSGLYQLEVKDAEGCRVTKSAFVGIRSLSVSTSVTMPDCHGGSEGAVVVTGVRYGTEPFTYLWSTGDTTASISSLESGKYTVTITDSMGCTINKSMNVTDPPELNLNYSVSARDCSVPSAVEVNLQGTGGMGSYEYYLGDSLAGPVLNLPGDGDYLVTLMDARDCRISRNIQIVSVEHIYISTSITQPSCRGEESGSIIVSAGGGNLPYTYLWSDGVNNSTRTGLSPGEYSFDVIDAGGCSTSSSFSINPISNVEAEIVPPSEILCGTEIIVNGSVSENAGGFSWDIQSSDSSWVILDSGAESAGILAGNGGAVLYLSAWNEDGCYDTDSLSLNCNSAPGGGDGGGDNGGSGDDPGQTDCMTHVWETEILEFTPLDDHCFHIELLVKTTGVAEHELSHLVVGLEYGQVSNLHNSENWKTEMNFADPKSGIYGFKIDDISGFGKGEGNEFTIDFDVCFDNPDMDDFLPEVFEIVYKASTCSYLQELSVTAVSYEFDGISVSAFPNPFIDDMNIRLSSPRDTEVVISIFDLRGNQLRQLYKGRVAADVVYTFPVHAADTRGENIIIYKIKTSDEVIQGRILKLK